MTLADVYSKLIEKDVETKQLLQNPLVSKLLKATGVDGDTLLDLKETVAGEVEKAKIFLKVTQ